MKAVNKLIKDGNRPLGRHLPEQVVFVVKSLIENKVVFRELDLTEVYTNQVWERAQAGMDQ